MSRRGLIIAAVFGLIAWALLLAALFVGAGLVYR